MQGALDIDAAIEIERMLLIGMMNPRRQMNHGVHAFQRFPPVGLRTDRLDQGIVGTAPFGPHRAADNPSRCFAKTGSR